MSRQLRVMVGHSWLVALAVVALGGAAYLRASLQPDVYQGEAVVRVFNATTPGVPGAGGAARVDPVREVQTQASYMTSDTVRLGVVERVGSRYEAIKAVRVAAVPNSDLVRVRVESRSPAIAQEGTQAYADVYVETRRESISASLVGRADELRAESAKVQEEISSLDARITELVPPPEISPFTGRAILVPDTEEVKSLRARRAGLSDQLASTNNLAQQLTLEASIRQSSLEVVDPAELPLSPVRPVPLRDAAIGGAIGLFIGVALALLRERTSDRLRSVDEVEDTIRPLSALALVPFDKSMQQTARRFKHNGAAPTPAPVTAADPTAPVSESYRTLRAALLFSGAGRGAKTLLVTSSVDGEGKTTTAANLAVTMARSGSHVLVLDADLKRPTLHHRFGLENSRGLTSVLRREAPLSQVLSSVDIPGPGSLAVLVAGPDGWDATELLVSGLAGPLFEQLERSYDFVVVDSAPVLSGADPLALAHLTKGILLVTRVGRVGRRELQMTMQRLEQVSGVMVGVVVNAVSPGHAGYYHYDHYDRPPDEARSAPVSVSRGAAPAIAEAPVTAAPVSAPSPSPVPMRRRTAARPSSPAARSEPAERRTASEASDTLAPPVEEPTGTQGGRAAQVKEPGTEKPAAPAEEPSESTVERRSAPGTRMSSAPVRQLRPAAGHLLLRALRMGTGTARDGRAGGRPAPRPPRDDRRGGRPTMP